MDCCICPYSGSPNSRLSAPPSLWVTFPWPHCQFLLMVPVSDHDSPLLSRPVIFCQCSLNTSYILPIIFITTPVKNLVPLCLTKLCNSHIINWFPKFRFLPSTNWTGRVNLLKGTPHLLLLDWKRHRIGRWAALLWRSGPREGVPSCLQAGGR
jgi:hypothetical protein